MPTVPITESDLLFDPNALRSGIYRDSFGQKVAGKSQDRVPQPSPTNLAMAAAIIHEQGRLFKPLGE